MQIQILLEATKYLPNEIFASEKLHFGWDTFSKSMQGTDGFCGS